MHKGMTENITRHLAITGVILMLTEIYAGKRETEIFGHDPAPYKQKAARSIPRGIHKF